VSDRFAKQREFLKNNPDVFLVGSWALFVDCSGKPLQKQRKHYIIGWFYGN